MNKTKKLLSIIALTIVGLFAIAVIMLAIIPVDFNKDIVDSTDAIYVIARNGSNKEKEFTTSDPEFKKIYEEYTSSHKESVLSALFQGAFGHKMEIETDQNNISLDSIKSSGVSIEFGYLNAKTLKIDGKEYKYGTADNQKTVSYNAILVTVNDSDNIREYDIYLISNNSSRVHITSFAKQHKLYNILEDLDYVTIS